jgi:hypothetical protein
MKPEPQVFFFTPNHPCIKIQSQLMTVVKYNNCEFSGQNTTENRSTLSGVGG